MENWNLLSIITFLPLVGVLFILLIPQGSDESSKRNSKSVALWTSLITFLISLLLLIGFDKTDPSFQFVEKIIFASFLCLAILTSSDKSFQLPAPKEHPNKTI